MSDDQAVILAIVVIGIIVLIILGRAFVRLTKKSARSMSAEEVRGQILQKRLNDPDEQIRQVAYTARRGRGAMKWMAIIIVIGLVLDGILLKSKALLAILETLAGLIGR